MHNMDPNAASGDVPAKDPYLPPLVRVGDLLAPKPPVDIAEARLEEGVLTDLAARLAYTVARFTTDWMAKQLHLSLPLVSEVLERLCHEGIVEQTLQTSQTRAHYRITDRGQEHGTRLMEVCGYIGPAPVRLEVYSA